MALGQGFRTKAGLAKEGDQSVWSPATPAAVLGAGDLIPLLSETIEETVNRLPVDVLEGKAGRKADDVVGRRYAGTIRVRGQYSGMESLLAFGFGAEEPQASPTTGVGSYTRYYEPDATLQTRSWQFGEGFRFGDGLRFGDQRAARGTLCIDKDVSIWEFRSVMVNALEIAATPSEGLTLSADIVARDLSRSSTANTGSTGWTFPGGTNRILFQDLAARLGTYSTATGLSTGDIVRISALTVRLENSLEANTQTANSSQSVEEPVRGGVRTVTGSITVPRYQTDVQLDRYEADTTLMADFKFTGPSIGSSTGKYRFILYFPSLKLTRAGAPVAGPGTIATTYEFEALVPAPAAGAGFPSDRNGREFFVELVNDVATNILYTT